MRFMNELSKVVVTDVANTPAKGRIALSAAHTEADIHRLVLALDRIACAPAIPPTVSHGA